MLEAAAATTSSSASAPACSSRARSTCSTEAGLGDRLHREGLVHDGIELRFDGEGHRIDLSELTGGRAITIYGQQEVVKDLIAARLARRRRRSCFEVDDVGRRRLDGRRPRIALHARRRASRRSTATSIAGCDGFHGICRAAIPAGALTVYERDYPFAWLGILAEARAVVATS